MRESWRARSTIIEGPLPKQLGYSFAFSSSLWNEERAQRTLLQRTYYDATSGGETVRPCEYQILIRLSDSDSDSKNRRIRIRISDFNLFIYLSCSSHLIVSLSLLVPTWQTTYSNLFTSNSSNQIVQASVRAFMGETAPG